MVDMNRKKEAITSDDQLNNIWLGADEASMDGETDSDEEEEIQRIISQEDEEEAWEKRLNAETKENDMTNNDNPQ